jgi:hypothetical protein
MNQSCAKIYSEIETCFWYIIILLSVVLCVTELLKDSAIAEVPFCFQQLLTFSATAETGPLPLRMWFLATDFISRTMRVFSFGDAIAFHVQRK